MKVTRHLIPRALAVLHAAVVIAFALRYLRLNIQTNVRDQASEGPESEALKAIDAEMAQLPVPEHTRPLFDRLVFVVLDAWRWNFLLDPASPMHETRRCIAEQRIIPFVAVARVPTVTKASIRSIMSGARPVFFDLLENVDDSGLLSKSGNEAVGNGFPGRDSVLRRFWEGGRRIAAYGDDVWTKLFPSWIYSRLQVGFSFNILDYTKVDESVRAGLAHEIELDHLNKDPADLLILHFLGLDHIGHSFPKRADLFTLKLSEYDSDLKRIMEWLDESDRLKGRKSLLLALGDHGMTPDGNHSGGSLDETNAAALFYASGLKPQPESATDFTSQRHYHHEDIATTLLALTDPTAANPLPGIPGLLIEELVESVDVGDAATRWMILRNLKHLLSLNPKNEKESIDGKAVIDALSRHADNRELFALSRRLKTAIDSHRSEPSEDETSRSLLWCVLLMLFIGMGWLLQSKLKVSSLLESFGGLIGTGSVIAIGLHQSTTSYLLEEHLLWQVALALTLLGHCIDKRHEGWKMRVRVFALLAIQRILRTWNSVGKVWRAEKSISTFIANSRTLEVAVLIGSVLYCGGVRWQSHWKSGLLRGLSMAFFAAGLLSVALYHGIGRNEPLLARAGILFIGLAAGASRHWDTECFLATAILLNKTHNAGCLALIHGLGSLLGGLSDDTLLRLFASQAAFFALGLWNSASAIDLTAGAVFSRHYDMIIAPLVLVVSVFSGPALLLSSARKYASVKEARSSNAMWMARSWLSLTALAAAYIHRQHPFNFDTFSPKIMFETLWSGFYLLEQQAHQ